MPEYSNSVLSFFDDTGTPLETHVKLTSVGIPTNSEASGDGSGGLYEESLSLTGFAPVVNWTSKAISQFLDFIPIDGQCVGSAYAVTLVNIILRKLETCEAALGATPHMRYAVADGLLRLGSLTAERNADATISGILDTFTDGTNAPVAETDGVAMPTPLVTERYRLGLCKIAGIVFPDIEGISIEYNVSISEKTPAFGLIWPAQAGVLTVRPVLVLRGKDLSKVKTGLIELGATTALHADSLIQLIKLLDAGSYETFASSVHISMTIDGMALPDDLASSSGGRAANEIRIPLKHDGTNLPIVTDTTAAYLPTGS